MYCNNNFALFNPFAQLDYHWILAKWLKAVRLTSLEDKPVQVNDLVKPVQVENERGLKLKYGPNLHGIL